MTGYRALMSLSHKYMFVHVSPQLCLFDPREAFEAFLTMPIVIRA